MASRVKEYTLGLRFWFLYEIAVVRPLKQTTRKERKEALDAAYYDTELIPQESV